MTVRSSSGPSPKTSSSTVSTVVSSSSDRISTDGTGDGRPGKCLPPDIRWRITAADAAGSLFWTKLWWDEVESVARIGRVTCFKVKPDVRICIDMVSRPLTGQEYREIIRSET